MKMKHLFLTLALAGVAALSVGAFAGCGDDNKTPDTGNNPPITGDEGGNQGNQGNQGTTTDHGTVTSSSKEATGTAASWTTGSSDDIKVIYANGGAMMMVNYTKYTLTLGSSGENGYTISQQKANATILDETATDTGDDIYVIGDTLPSASAPGPNGGPTDALDGRKVKVVFSDAADAKDDKGNLLNVNYEGKYYVKNGDYVLLSAISLTKESADAGATITSDTFKAAQTAGMLVKLSAGGKFEIENIEDSYVTAEANKNEFMGWSTTYTLSYVENVGYFFAEVRETYPKNEDNEVNWNAEPTATQVTVYIGIVYTAYSDGTITLGECNAYSVGMDGKGSVGSPKGGWYKNGFEVKVDSEKGTFAITSENTGGTGELPQ